MIRVQKLKEPKKTSGKKLESGDQVKIKGLLVLNTNKFPVYVDAYERKKAKPKAE